ncbi:hypothetical protein [Modestobacter roseus]|uniref:Uncharacterized protein n=1 Tax=Modestobacter roseus TaxID=1181884 RepID=A0A562IRX8_9ACTN|nr:hypothetical protein [Modestobacter roseus]MQA32562.1 hypothetical protein [Modestobacter roseus]TWH73797.1 hypothetical protein JD78_02321 [Modestobacter roseus]
MGTLDRGPWGRDGRHDPNGGFLGEQASVGNAAGPDLAVARLIRWLGRRRDARRAGRSRDRSGG